MTFGDLDTSIPDTAEKNTPLTLSPEQEAKIKEWLDMIDKSTYEIDGVQVIYDVVSVARLGTYLYTLEIGFSDEFRQILDKSSDWLVERRQQEAAAGILYSESLCWLYSKEQLAKIEANPTDESLYGKSIAPYEREKRIKETKKWLVYLEKWGDQSKPQQPPSPIPPIEKPIQKWVELDAKPTPVAVIEEQKEPEPYWTESGFVYGGKPKGGMEFVK